MVNAFRCMPLAILPLLLLTPFAVGEPPETPQAETHARQSYVLAQEGRLPEAETEMQEAIRIAPQNPLYHSALAGLLSKGGKLHDAKSEFEKALDLHPVPAVRAQLLERLKEVDLKLGAQLGKSGRYRDGIQLASGAAARFQDDARVFQMLGYFQTKLQLNKDAVRSYSRALQLDPSSPEASVGLATSQFSVGLGDDSIRTLEAGIVRFPDDAIHYQALGVVLLQLSEQGRDTRARARTMFEKALRLNGVLAESNYQLGRIELDSNEMDSAEAHLLAAERTAPLDSRVHFVLARLYRKQGNAERAEHEMKMFLAAKSKEGGKKGNDPR
jgi:Tfp pilus assembly protein PilF